MSNASFTMDGTEHTDYTSTGCCQYSGKACKCGGWMHYQAIYGGYYYECDICHARDI